MIKHHPSNELLAKFSEGNLPATLSVAVAIHVEMCPVCQKELAALEAKNIGTSVHYRPLHMMPYYKDHLKMTSHCPHAEESFAHILSLPLYPDLTTQQLEQIFDAILTLLAMRKGRSL